MHKEIEQRRIFIIKIHKYVYVYEAKPNEREMKLQMLQNAKNDPK